jgi:farnesyl diphosphate synthase
VARAGAAIELVHCYSLVHDDLPAMDDDDLRRGKPTVHRAFDEATAILVGDGLQTLAFEVLADPETDPDPGRRSDLVLGLAKASGIGGMVGGQMLDLAAEGRYGDQSQDEASIRQLQAMKTGAILAFSVEAGAICGGADAGRAASAAPLRPRARRRLSGRRRPARPRGDRRGPRQAHRQGSRKGKATLVDALGVEGARAECARLVDEGFAALERFGPAADILREAARFTVARKT